MAKNRGSQRPILWAVILSLAALAPAALRSDGAQARQTAERPARDVPRLDFACRRWTGEPVARRGTVRRDLRASGEPQARPHARRRSRAGRAARTRR